MNNNEDEIRTRKIEACRKHLNRYFEPSPEASVLGLSPVSSKDSSSGPLPNSTQEDGSSDDDSSSGDVEDSLLWLPVPKTPPAVSPSLLTPSIQSPSSSLPDLVVEVEANRHDHSPRYYARLLRYLRKYMEHDDPDWSPEGSEVWVSDEEQDRPGNFQDIKDTVSDGNIAHDQTGASTHSQAESSSVSQNITHDLNENPASERDTTQINDRISAVSDKYTSQGRIGVTTNSDRHTTRSEAEETVSHGDAEQSQTEDSTVSNQDSQARGRRTVSERKTTQSPVKPVVSEQDTTHDQSITALSDRDATENRADKSSVTDINLSTCCDLNQSIFPKSPIVSQILSSMRSKPSFKADGKKGIPSLNSDCLKHQQGNFVLELEIATEDVEEPLEHESDIAKADDYCQEADICIVTSPVLSGKITQSQTLQRSDSVDRETPGTSSRRSSINNKDSRTSQGNTSALGSCIMEEEIRPDVEKENSADESEFTSAFEKDTVLEQTTVNRLSREEKMNMVFDKLLQEEREKDIAAQMSPTFTQAQGKSSESEQNDVETKAIPERSKIGSRSFSSLGRNKARSDIPQDISVDETAYDRNVSIRSSLAQNDERLSDRKKSRLRSVSDRLVTGEVSISDKYSNETAPVSDRTRAKVRSRSERSGSKATVLDRNTSQLCTFSDLNRTKTRSTCDQDMTEVTPKSDKSRYTGRVTDRKWTIKRSIHDRSESEANETSDRNKSQVDQDFERYPNDQELHMEDDQISEDLCRDVERTQDSTPEYLRFDHIIVTTRAQVHRDPSPDYNSQESTEKNSSGSSEHVRDYEASPEQIRTEKLRGSTSSYKHLMRSSLEDLRLETHKNSTSRLSMEEMELHSMEQSEAGVDVRGSNEDPMDSNEDQIIPVEHQMDLDEAQISSEETQIGPEETQIDPEETQIDPEETQIGPEETRICSEETQIGPEETRICSEETQIGSEETQIGPEETQIGPEETEIGPDETQISQEETQIFPEDTEIGPEETQISTEETQIGKEEAQIGSEETQIGPKETQIDSEETQIGPNVVKTCSNLEERRSLCERCQQETKSKRKSSKSTQTEEPNSKRQKISSRNVETQSVFEDIDQNTNRKRKSSEPLDERPKKDKDGDIPSDGRVGEREHDTQNLGSQREGERRRLKGIKFTGNRIVVRKCMSHCCSVKFIL